MYRIVLAILLLTGSGGATVAADDHRHLVRDLVENHAQWLRRHPLVMAELTTRKERQRPLGDDELQALDRQWRTEVRAGGGDLVRTLLETRLSRLLREVHAGSNGMITEILITDTQALNAAASDMVPGYWQGKRGLWRNTFFGGPDAVFVSKLVYQSDSGILQSQVSYSIAGPDPAQVIGVLTIGVNAAFLP